MLSLVLLGVSGLQLAFPVEPDLPQSTQFVPRRDRVEVLPLPSNFPEILRRPIFAVDRRPMVEAMDGFVLLGTGSIGNAYTALLQVGGRVVRVHDGDLVMGWRVASLSQDRVFFERNEERRMVLFDLKSRRSAMMPPPVARSQ